MHTNKRTTPYLVSDLYGKEIQLLIFMQLDVLLAIRASDDKDLLHSEIINFVKFSS